MKTDPGMSLNRFLKHLNQNRSLNLRAHLIEMTPHFRLVFSTGRRSFKGNLNHWMKP